MPPILRIDGPALVRPNEQVTFRAIVSSDMGAVERRRLEWAIATTTAQNPYLGEVAGHLVDRRASGTMKVSVKSPGGQTLSRSVSIEALKDPGKLASAVMLDPIPERVPPFKIAKGKVFPFSASVGGGPMIRVGQLTHWPATDTAPAHNGIYSVTATRDAIYRASDFHDLGFWSEIIEPTVDEESRLAFTAVNTYDTARFSFGIIQFASHTYDDNFQKLFTTLLTEEEYRELAKRYFPEFESRRVAGQQEIFGRSAATGEWSQLTMASDLTNLKLRVFLKPVVAWVTSEELSFAARMIVATRCHPKLQRLQAKLAIASGKAKFAQLVNEGAPMDGLRDELCVWTFDTRNHGRAGPKRVTAALKASDPVAEFKKFHHDRDDWKRRIDRLEKIIARRVQQGIFGKKKFNVQTQEFDDL